ncbi:MAG: hypothetical protein HY507_01935 [Candidatus Zambryskibacteria bacterium]|nr:hypothetical protein [Candidatus Zambryskibacteria bacterium]
MNTLFGLAIAILIMWFGTDAILKKWAPSWLYGLWRKMTGATKRFLLRQAKIFARWFAKQTACLSRQFFRWVRREPAKFFKLLWVVSLALAVLYAAAHFH